jgi:uncharacterized protein YqjF (DUF2071 family)
MSAQAGSTPNLTRAPFLTAQWRSLVMLNYEMDPAVLQPLVPRGTELDFWNDKTFVSMVGFLFLDTRLRGVPIPLHTNFPEVNLRFYVRHKAADGWRRGVTFVREIVPRPAIALVANTFYNERYLALPMRHDVDLERDGGHAEYSWRHNGRWNFLRAQTHSDWCEMQNNSPEEFITEHYWGYAAQRDGGTLEYAVEHPCWRVRLATQSKFEADTREIYGENFAPFLSGAPASAFVAEGSPVAVHQGVRIC